MNIFTGKTLLPIKKAIDKALAEVGAEHGLSFNIGKITFFDTSFTAKIECVINNGESGNSVAKNTWDRYCYNYGLTPESFGKKFTSNGNLFEICGCKPNNHKYPIIAKNLGNGKQYKFNIASVANKTLRA